MHNEVFFQSVVDELLKQAADTVGPIKQSTLASLGKNVMTRGESKGKPVLGVDPKELKQGTNIEKEHTTDKVVARKIALDHVKEHKDYYDDKKGLPAMERRLEKGAAFKAKLRRWGRKVLGPSSEQVGRIRRRHEDASYKASGSGVFGMDRPKRSAVRTKKAVNKMEGLLHKRRGRLKAAVAAGSIVIPVSTAISLGLLSKKRAKDKKKLEKAGGLASTLKKVKAGDGIPGRVAGHQAERMGAHYMGKQLSRLGSKPPEEFIREGRIMRVRSRDLVDAATHQRNLKKLTGETIGKRLKKIERRAMPKKGTIVKPTGALRSDPGSMSKQASFMEGFLDELEKVGVQFGKDKSRLWIKRRSLKRKIFGAPKTQVDRMTRKHHANVAAAEFGGSAKDYRAAASSRKALSKVQSLVRTREQRLRSLNLPKRVGTSVKRWANRNPELAMALGVPPLFVASLAGTAALSKAVTHVVGPKKRSKKRSKKTAMSKHAGPATLAKLRRAYPRGKVVPAVDSLMKSKKVSDNLRKAATLSGRVKYMLKRVGSPIRRLQAAGKGEKAMDKGKVRKALRYGGVSAGLGPSFGRESKKAKSLVKDLAVATAKT